MKKTIVILLSSALLLGSCGTNMGEGAYAGTSLGGLLGSAIGGIAQGPRGSDIGTLVGMAGGAIIGGAIGHAQDQKQQEQTDQYKRDRAARAAERNARRQTAQSTAVDVAAQEGYGSGFDASNSGDDRIYDFSSSDYTGDYTARQPETTMPLQSSVDDLAQGLRYTPNIEIVNARFVDDNEDGKIQRGELCKIIFEVMNRGSQPVYDVQPTVVEASGNKHIYVSPNMHVEQIAPGRGIRYTAMVKADRRLKAGTAKFCVSVIQGTSHISKVTEFNIPTVR